jgi:hypothetical protein
MPARLEAKTRDSLSKRAHFAAILPLAKPFEPDVLDLVEKAQRVVSPAGAKVLLHPDMRKLEKAEERRGLTSFLYRPTDTKMVYLVIDHVGVWIAARDEPMTHRGDLTRWPNPEVWPEGAETVSRHGAYVEICDLGFMRDRGVERLDRAFNRAAAVTAAMAAVVASSEPLGMLWHPAKNGMRLDAFADQVAQAVMGQAPLDLWMRWFFVKPEVPQHRPGVITRGLFPFIGHEIEVRPSPAPSEDALRLAREFASMVIDRGARARTGMIVSLSRDLSATVRVGESRTREGLPVFELSVNRPVEDA